MKQFFIIFRSIIYVPLFILLFGWIAQSVRVFDPQISVMFPLWLRPAGIVFMTLGGLLVLICVGVFIFIGKGTPAVFDPPTKFVAKGPYAYVRNPMYIGGFILLVGFWFVSIIIIDTDSIGNTSWPISFVCCFL